MAKNYDRIGLGVIARDSLGHVVIARSIKMEVDVEPAAAEAMAALHGMLLGHDLGPRRKWGIIFKGDALQVVTAINSPDPCNRGYRHFVENFQEGLKAIRNSCFNHILN